MTFDELLSILRGWTGRTVTMLASPGFDQTGPDDPITGTLFEGHAPAVTARMINPPEYEPTPDQRLRAIADRESRTIEDVAYDRMLQHDGRALLLYPLLNFGGGSYDALYEMMTDPITVQGLSQLLQRVGIHYKAARDYIHSPDPDYEAKLAYIAHLLAEARASGGRRVLLYQDELTYYRQPTLARASEARGRRQPLAQRSHAANPATRVAATDAGRACLLEAAPAYLSTIRAHLFDGLSERDVKQLARIFWRIASRSK